MTKRGDQRKKNPTKTGDKLKSNQIIRVQRCRKMEKLLQNG